MNNKEIILKYLSDLMNEKERQQFEERLKSDNKLKNEFDKINADLYNLCNLSKFETESTYFNNIIPKVFKRLETNKQKRILIYVPSLSLVLTAIIIFILQIPNMKQNGTFELSIPTEELSAIISEADSLNFDELYGLNPIDNYIYNREIKDKLDLYFNDFFISEISDDIINLYYKDGIKDYNELSEEEVNIVYKEIINKKIL